MECKKCRTINSEESYYCNKCGSKLESNYVNNVFNKTSIKLIILVTVIIGVFIAYKFIKSSEDINTIGEGTEALNYNISESEEAYKNGLELYKKRDKDNLELAYLEFKKVKSTDQNNYKNAQEKINELNDVLYNLYITRAKNNKNYQKHKAFNYTIKALCYKPKENEALELKKNLLNDIEVKYDDMLERCVYFEPNFDIFYNGMFQLYIIDSKENLSLKLILGLKSNDWIFFNRILLKNETELFELDFEKKDKVEKVTDHGVLEYINIEVKEDLLKFLKESEKEDIKIRLVGKDLQYEFSFNKKEHSDYAFSLSFWENEVRYYPLECFEILKFAKENMKNYEDIMIKDMAKK